MTVARPNAANRPILAVDLGASRIRAGVVDATGRVLARSSGDTPGGEGPDAVLDTLLHHLHVVRDQVDDATRDDLAGLGISAPGPLDPRRGILVDPPNIGPGFAGMALAAPLGEALGLPAALERDTVVAALGEGAFGAARGARHFVYITVSTGVGGAIIADGQVLGGADGVAGEIGHQPSAMGGPMCGCGAAGHLEAFASGSGIARRAADAIAAGEAPGLAESARRQAPTPLQASDVAAAADAGDPVATALLEDARRAFAHAVVGLVNVFNPELVVVGGGIARGQGERLLGPAREAVERWAFSVPRRRVRMVEAALGDDVGLVGSQPLLERGRR
jgi:glucokinase